jgi:Phage integrase, N-terminal SAM-like domain
MNYCDGYAGLLKWYCWLVFSPNLAQDCTMPRHIDISKKNARTDAVLGKRYTQTIGSGLHLVYRRSEKSGKWFAKLKRPGDGVRYDYKALGVADDRQWGGKFNLMSYDQAIQAARDWARLKEAERTGEVVPGVHTVADAMRDYVKDRAEALKIEPDDIETHPKLKRTHYVIKRHIIPHLGTHQLKDLRYSHLSAWRNALVARRKRGKVTNDPEAIRKRHSTANRIWTILRAGLITPSKRAGLPILQRGQGSRHTKPLMRRRYGQ